MSASKVIVITGASSGIGATLAKQLAPQGHRLALGMLRLQRSQSGPEFPHGQPAHGPPGSSGHSHFAGHARHGDNGLRPQRAGRDTHNRTAARIDETETPEEATAAPA